MAVSGCSAFVFLLLTKSTIRNSLPLRRKPIATIHLPAVTLTKTQAPRPIRLNPLSISEYSVIKRIYLFIDRNDITLFILFSIDCCTFVPPKQKTGQYKRICYEQ
jgi:hypothetical protein